MTSFISRPFKVYASKEEIEAAADRSVVAAAAAVVATKTQTASPDVQAKASTAAPQNSAGITNVGVSSTESKKRKADAADVVDKIRMRAPTMSIKPSHLVAMPVPLTLPPSSSSSAALLAKAFADRTAEAAAATAAAIAAKTKLEAEADAALAARPVDHGNEQDHSTPWPVALGFTIGSHFIAGAGGGDTMQQPAFAPPAPHPWKICIDPATKRQYYFNSTTGRSLWTLQGALNAGGTPMVIKPAIPTPWEEYVDPQTLRQVPPEPNLHLE